MGVRLSLIVCAAALSACASFPQEKPSQVARGRLFVSRACAGCHAIGDGGASRNPDAPPFRTLASRLPGPALTRALTGIVRNGHVRMPPVYMTPGELADVAAYIRSLPPQRPSAGPRDPRVST